jgi:hypothetical protein
LFHKQRVPDGVQTQALYLLQTFTATLGFEGPINALHGALIDATGATRRMLLCLNACSSRA